MYKSDKISLSRAELSGIQLGSRLVVQVKRALMDNNPPSFVMDEPEVVALSDSMSALLWLNSAPEKLLTYCANRCQEIRKLMPARCWRHVSSELNTADLTTRPQHLAELVPGGRLSKFWFEGPDIYKYNNDEIGSRDFAKSSQDQSEYLSQFKPSRGMESQAVVLSTVFGKTGKVTKKACVQLPSSREDL